MKRCARIPAVFLFVALALLASAGCAAGRRQAASPRVEKELPYARIAIVQFVNRTPHSGTGQTFTEALRMRLAERTRGTDVIVIPPSALSLGEDPFVDGRVPLSALVRMRKEHLVDAVVIGAVESHDPYRPPAVHLSLKVVDTARGQVMFEMSDGWDGATRRVQDMIEGYYRSNIGRDDCRFGPNIFLISPSYYLGFVADRVADRMSRELISAG
jgi:hypothetical protein